jgi:hypothetical protein
VIRAARRVHEARLARELGLGVSPDLLPDFGAAMERMRAIRARISHEDSAARYHRDSGADVFFGNARLQAWVRSTSTAPRSPSRRR